MACYDHCTPDTCTCVPSVDELRAAYKQRGEGLRQELERVEREYEEAGRPFGEEGLDIWLELGDESAMN